MDLPIRRQIMRDKDRSARELQVFDAALERLTLTSYRWPKLALLIEEDTEFPRSSIIAALASLVSAGYLLQNEDGYCVPLSREQRPHAQDSSRKHARGRTGIISEAI